MKRPGDNQGPARASVSVPSSPALIETSGALAASLERLNRRSVLDLLAQLLRARTPAGESGAVESLAALCADLQRQLDEQRTLIEANRALLEALDTTSSTTQASWTSLSLCARLRHLLDERDMTQAELARQTGLSTSKIGRLVRSQRTPKPGELERIAAALGLTFAKLQLDEP